jgi:hypothetical protein
MEENHKASPNKKSHFMLNCGQRLPFYAGIKKVIISFLALLFSSMSFAQHDSINKKNDSVNTSIIQSFNKKLTLIEGQSITDSIKRAKLELQLLSLKTSDNRKKEDLQKQLQALNEKESNRLAEKKHKSILCGLPPKGILLQDFLMTLCLPYTAN